MRNLVTLVLFGLVLHMTLVATEHCQVGPGGKYSSGNCGLISGRDLCPEMVDAADMRIRQSEELLGIPLCSLSIIKDENDYDNFFSIGGVQFLYFLQEEHRQGDVAAFLSNYNLAAKDVCSHGISMAVVMCSSYRDPTHCSSEKRSKFVYIFRGGQEVDATPVDKFSSMDSIVSTALQHTLGNLVTVVQDFNERKELEKHHLHKKDVIFAYIDSFNSPAHHHFLELAKEYKDRFSFGLTTFRLSATGLQKPDNFAKNPAVLWVLQCTQPARKEIFDERSVICPSTLYNGGHKEIHDFLATFNLGLYHEIQTEDLRHQDTPLRSAFEKTYMPYAILVFDSKSEERVREIATDMAQSFRGNIALHLARQGVIKTPRINSYLKINVEELRPPAIVFFVPGEGEKAAVLNDFESPYDWLLEKLKKYLAAKSPAQVKLFSRKLKDEEVRILTQDDELASTISEDEEEQFPSVGDLSCPKCLRKAIMNTKESTAVAFYIPYDALSVKMLRVVQASSTELQDLHSSSTVHKFDCFDYTNVCDSLGIKNMPSLFIFDAQGNSHVYRGPLESESVTNAILIGGCTDNPKKMNSDDALDSFLHRTDPSCQATKFIKTRIAGIFPNERAAGNAVFESIAEEHQRDFIFGHVISEDAVKNRCPATSGCILVSNPDDAFRKETFITEDLRDREATLSAFRRATLGTFSPLNSRNEQVISNLEVAAPSTTHVVLILKSSPCKMKVMEYVKTLNGGQGSRDLTSDDLGLMASVGRIANEFSKPGLIFSYVDRNNPMRDTILNDYKLSSDRNHLVAIDRKMGQVSTFPSGSVTENSIRKWVENVLASNVEANLVLPSGDWKPVLHGFDYFTNLRKKYEKDDVKLLAFEKAFVGAAKVLSK